MTPLPAEEDRPGVPAPPPLFVFGPLAALLLLELALPTRVMPSPWRWLAATLLFGAGAAANLAGALTQRRAGTDFLPDHPSTTVVSHGIYGWTRNPMYVGFLLAAAGIALAFDSWWGLASLPIGLALIDRVIVRREERYLERKFGDLYLAYKTRVRRWI